MKKTIISILLFLLFAVTIFFGEIATNGALYGLKLWLFSIIPSLYPLLIITELLKNTNAINQFADLFKIRSSFISPIILGCVCGYPVGAKLVKDAYTSKSINYDEAVYLLTFVNNPGLAFFITYIFGTTIGSREYLPLCAFCLYLSIFLTAVITRYIFHSNSYEKIASNNKYYHKCFDDIIYDESMLMIKIGGYIVIFSVVQHILLFLFDSLELNNIYIKVLLCTLEISNGISLISSLVFPQKYICLISCLLAITCGLSIIFQIKSVLSSTDLPVYPVIIGKLIQSILFSILFFLICQFH